jgi:hypothetical protein
VKSYLPGQSGEADVFRRWWLSLGLGLAVTAAAGALLLTLARMVDGIHLAAGAVWQAGKLIANNTVHVPHLRHINAVAEQIGESLEAVEGSTARIRQSVERTSRKED